MQIGHSARNINANEMYRGESVWYLSDMQPIEETAVLTILGPQLYFAMLKRTAAPAPIGRSSTAQLGTKRRKLVQGVQHTRTTRITISEK